MPRGDWCYSTTARCGGRAKVPPSSRSRTRIAHSPSAFSAGGDSSFGFGGGAFFFLGFFPMPICVGGDEARGRGRAGQRRAGKLKAARAVEGAPSEKKPHREGRGRDAPRGRRAGARRARRRTIASRHATTRDAASPTRGGARRGAHLVLDVSDVLVNLRLLEERLERLALGSARPSHGRAGPVLVPPRHRAAVEPGVDGEVVFVQG